MCVFQCSSDCGEGTRERTVTCTNPQGLCDPLSQPTLKEPCEDHSKCYEWKTGDWSKVENEFKQAEDIVKFQSHLQLEAHKTQAEQAVLHCVKDEVGVR